VTAGGSIGATRGPKGDRVRRSIVKSSGEMQLRPEASEVAPESRNPNVFGVLDARDPRLVCVEKFGEFCLSNVTLDPELMKGELLQRFGSGSCRSGGGPLLGRKGLLQSAKILGHVRHSSCSS
jgi:hypothetical protein